MPSGMSLGVVGRLSRRRIIGRSRGAISSVSRGMINDPVSGLNEFRHLIAATAAVVCVLLLRLCVCDELIN